MMLQQGIPTDFPRYRLKVQDFHKLGEIGILDEDARVELVEGELIEMAPIGSLHASVVNTLNRMLILAVGEAGIICPQNPVVLDSYSEPQPDLAVVRPQTRRYRDSHPHAEDILLLIEVADTTARYDRTVKIPLYARHGIPEVWLVDLQQRHVEIYRDPEEGSYRQVKVLATGSLTLSQLSGVTMDITGLF
jgi:Uma2 family endonuclease